MKRPYRALAPLIACTLFAGVTAGASRAEVTDVTSLGFTVHIERHLAADPGTAWSKLVDEVGTWWHPDHTFSGDAGRLSIDPTPQGCFCESLPDGGGVRHLTVIYADPGKRLRLAGGLGPLQEYAVAGSLNVELEPAEDDTRLTLRYTVGGYVDGGLTEWAPIVEAVLTEQMDRLTRYVATGQATQ